MKNLKFDSIKNFYDIKTDFTDYGKGVIRIHNSYCNKEKGDFKRNQLVKINYKGKFIYRILRFCNLLHNNEIAMEYDDKVILTNNDEGNLIDLTLSKACKLMLPFYLWTHVDPTIKYVFRIAAIWGLISIFCNLILIIL